MNVFHTRARMPNLVITAYQWLLLHTHMREVYLNSPQRNSIYNLKQPHGGLN